MAILGPPIAAWLAMQDTIVAGRDARTRTYNIKSSVQSTINLLRCHRSHTASP